MNEPIFEFIDFILRYPVLRMAQNQFWAVFWKFKKSIIKCTPVRKGFMHFDVLLYFMISRPSPNLRRASFTYH